MPAYSIVPATAEHVSAMLPHVRQADRDEIAASAGRPMFEILGQSVRLSDMAWAGLVDDEVACIFGVRGASMLSETGYPWLIGTDLIERHAKAFLRRNRAIVQIMLERYPYLTNYVDVRNGAAIQWLKWLGFTMLPAAPYGAAQLPFHQFEQSRER
jgi:hypothetical protein